MLSVKDLEKLIVKTASSDPEIRRIGITKKQLADRIYNLMDCLPAQKPQKTTIERHIDKLARSRLLIGRRELVLYPSMPGRRFLNEVA